MWLFKDPKPLGELTRAGFCEIHAGLGQQPKCQGCRIIETLNQYWNRPQPSAQGKSVCSKPILIHRSFQELDFCAERCITCRVLRRGILLHQPTFRDIAELKRDVEAPVWASVMGSGYNLKLIIKIGKQVGNGTDPTEGVVVNLQVSSNHTDELRLPQTANDLLVFGQIRAWAEDCHGSNGHAGHAECGNLGWSTQNPTRLIRILPNSNVQLVNSRSMHRVQYTALSYCWGNADQRGRTVTSNIGDRLENQFSLADLSRTISDAIRLTRNIGVDYIWVDSLCIIQDDPSDWTKEAAMMQSVYSNAYFTIGACAAGDADVGLIHSREAWRYVAEPCELNGRLRLVLQYPSLSEVKSKAKWSSRCWTLQEELLSSRMLYWTPHRMYWSCTKAQRMEQAASSRIDFGPGPKALNGADELAEETQTAFLSALWTGENLHETWQKIVASYTSRRLSNEQDRLTAISGLATRYQRRKQTDLYLAGLWKNSLARDLGWNTNTSRVLTQRRLESFPSWSWASVPIGFTVEWDKKWAATDHFQLIADDSFTQYDTKMDYVDRVRGGEALTSLVVSGRMRQLWAEYSALVPWSSVSEPTSEHSGFKFNKYVDREIHAVDEHTGFVVAYDSLGSETVGSLDELTHVHSIYNGSLDIRCLEIGAETMLLLAPCEGGDEQSLQTYRRIGLSTKFRRDFFENADIIRMNIR